MVLFVPVSSTQVIWTLSNNKLFAQTLPNYIPVRNLRKIIPYNASYSSFNMKRAKNRKIKVNPGQHGPKRFLRKYGAKNI